MPDRKSYQVQEFKNEFQRLTDSLSQRGTLGAIAYWKRSINRAGVRGEMASELREMEKLMPLARKVAVAELLRFSLLHSDFADLKSLEKALDESQPEEKEQTAFLKLQVEFLKKDKASIAEEQKKICGADKDLSKGFPKIRNQTNIGWCYAFAAADLASYHIGKKVSAADVATQFSTFYPIRDVANDKGKVNPKSFHRTGLEEGGFSDYALKIMVQKGICLEKDFPSEALYLQSGNRAASLKYIYEEIEVFQQVSKKFPSIANPYCQNIYDRVGKSMFPNIISEDFRRIFLESSKKSLITRLGEKSCEGRRKYALKNYEVITEYLNYEDPHSSAKYIVDQLDADQPMVASLPDSVVRKPYVYTGERNTNANHAVIISGKRWNPETGSCELKIRNSWGEENGDQWIPMGVIIPATSDVITMRKKTQI